MRKRSIIPYLPGNVSVFDVANLQKTISDTITSDLIRAIAEGGTEGRQLIVGATNLDYGLMRVWDLAQLSQESKVEKARDQAVSILMASAAIPGVFPPVMMDDFLYVDGGASMQLVGGTDSRKWFYNADNESVDFVSTDQPIKIRIWIIVNQKLLQEPDVVRSRWTSIASRSLGTLLRISTLQSIQDAETYVQLINQRQGFDAEMHFVAIPQEYPIDDSDEMFHKDTMRKLVKLGKKNGCSPS